MASKYGRVMDAKGAENGAQIQLWDKNGSEAQIMGAGSGRLHIVNPAVLDVGGLGNGANVQLLDKSGSATQLWTYLADGNIVNRATGMVDSAGNHTNGTIIQYRDHNRSSAQLWHLEPFL